MSAARRSSNQQANQVSRTTNNAMDYRSNLEGSAHRNGRGASAEKHTFMLQKYGGEHHGGGSKLLKQLEKYSGNGTGRSGTSIDTNVLLQQVDRHLNSPSRDPGRTAASQDTYVMLNEDERYSNIASKDTSRSIATTNSNMTFEDAHSWMDTKQYPSLTLQNVLRSSQIEASNSEKSTPPLLNDVDKYSCLASKDTGRSLDTNVLLKDMDKWGDMDQMQSKDTGRSDDSLDTNVLLKGFETHRGNYFIPSETARSAFGVATNVLLNNMPRSTEQASSRVGVSSENDSFGKLDLSDVSRHEMAWTTHRPESDGIYQIPDRSNLQRSQEAFGQRCSSISPPALFDDNDDHNKVVPFSTRSTASIATEILLQPTEEFAKVLRQKLVTKCLNTVINLSSRNKDREDNNGVDSSDGASEEDYRMPSDSNDKTKRDYMADVREFSNSDEHYVHRNGALSDWTSAGEKERLDKFDNDDRMKLHSNSSRQPLLSDTLMSYKRTENLDMSTLSSKENSNAISDLELRRASSGFPIDWSLETPVSSAVDSMRSLESGASLGQQIVRKSRKNVGINHGQHGTGNGRSGTRSWSRTSGGEIGHSQTFSFSKPLVPSHSETHSKIRHQDTDTRSLSPSGLTIMGSTVLSRPPSGLSASKHPTTDNEWIRRKSYNPRKSGADTTSKKHTSSNGMVKSNSTGHLHSGAGGNSVSQKFQYNHGNAVSQTSDIEDADLSNQTTFEEELMLAVYDLSLKVRQQASTLVSELGQRQEHPSRGYKLPNDLKHDLSAGSAPCNAQLMSILENLETTGHNLSVVHEAVSNLRRSSTNSRTRNVHP